MVETKHQTYVYVGLAGEGPLVVGAEGPALGPGGLYRRADGDAEWRSIDRGLPPNPQVRTLLVHPALPWIVYAGTQRGVYRSEDRGGRWAPLGAPPGDVWSLAFHPHDPDVIYAGYDRCTIVRTEDGGVSWRKMDTSNVAFPHITMHPTPIVKRVIGIAADPSEPMDVYGAIEVGGLVASRDGGETWESITDGHYTRMGPVDLHGVQVSAAAPGLVYIITQLAMFRSRERGCRWEFVPIEEMFPGGSYCRGLAVAPDDPRTMYLAAGAGGGSSPPGTVEAGALLRSRDAGDTWQRVDLGDTPPSRMFQIAIDPAAPSHVYCCTYHGQVYSSGDNGETWSKSRLPVETSRARHVYPMACG